MIEFVYFDLGNVLWKFDESLACQQVADEVGTTSDRVRQALYLSGLQTRFETGKVSPSALVGELMSQLGADQEMGREIDPGVILDAASDMFTPIESMVDVIGQVRQTGIAVGILSNTCSSHWDWINRQQHALMRGPFDSVVLSFEVGSMKPDDSIYRAAELALTCTPDRILFLDDKPENVEAARARGWRAEVCLGGDQAVAALARHHVLNPSDLASR